jgi:murein DD-endopeptidase MepM/ murein hydrolase activator NlpD
MKILKAFFAILASLFGRTSVKSTTKIETTVSTTVVDTTPDTSSEPVVVEEVEDTPVVVLPKWHVPIRSDKFSITQSFLNHDPDTYKKTGHHPGVDYGTQGEDMVPLYFCADGEVIETGLNQYFGNYFFYYVPEVDRTFVYFHLRDQAPGKGQYSVGNVCGITGQTGLSHGIHLHLECIKGRKTSEDRRYLYVSKDKVQECSEDADAFIRSRISL